MALISSSSSIDLHQSLSNRKVFTLPRIAHPSKYLNEEDRSSLDIRGKSRDGNGNGQLIRSETSTPDLAFNSHRRRRSSSLKQNPISSRTQLNDIPENISTIYGQDRDQVRLPVFGRRPDSTRSSCSIQSEKSNGKTERIILDEFEMILREKVRSQLHDVKTKFRHANDFDSNGKISRQALNHLIASIFGTQKQISPGQIDKLLERFHLKHLDKISFDEFTSSVLNGVEEVPGWVSRQSVSSKRTSSQVFLILKEKARTKQRELVLLCPTLDNGPPTRIFKSQLQSTLIEMGYRMNEREFDKLWDKFDTDGFHAVNSDKFVKRLLNEDQIELNQSIQTSETQDQQSAILKFQQTKSSRTDSHIQTPRLNTARSQLDDQQIGKWLNYKFPHGFDEFERRLDQFDTNKTGLLSREQFLNELKQFGITFENRLFDQFLKRFEINLTSTNDLIPYKDLINAFKQQTQSTNQFKQILSKSIENHRTGLEGQIEYLISMNTDEIRDHLNRIDPSHQGLINKQQMKSLIEDLLQFPLRPDEYQSLCKAFPQDIHGNIRYEDYLREILRRFYQRDQQQQQQQTNEKIPEWDYMRSKHIRESLDQEHFSKKKREKMNEFNDYELRTIRSFQQLREIVKRLIRDRYKDVEDEFKRLDRSSYGELTPQLLFHLFQRLSVEPEINPGEIDLLWSNCHLKENGNLDFYQFLREFGYTKRSAHYPNAKQNPPKKGDSDFLLTSRKLYADTVLVRGTALNAIRSNWDELRQELTQLDPYRTGFIQSDEFDEILTELCPVVNQEDLDIIKFRFQTKDDLRMNYVHFLKHHAPLPQLIEEIDEQSTNRNSYSRTNQNSSERYHQNDLQNKLKRKLSDSWKDLRRAFKQKDIHNTGSISVQLFRDVLSQFKCTLNDEEFYQLTSQLDTKMNGAIFYNYFIQQYLKNN